MESLFSLLVCKVQEVCSILKDFGQPLTPSVCMVVKIEEKNQEYQPIQPNDVKEHWELVGAVLHEEKLANMSGHHHKLNLKGTKNNNKLVLFHFFLCI